MGFRYTATKAARKYGATGWVRNEFDGSVSMEIQGSERQIDDVIAYIGRDDYIRISKIQTKNLELVPDEKVFGVKY